MQFSCSIPPDTSKQQESVLSESNLSKVRRNMGKAKRQADVTGIPLELPLDRILFDEHQPRKKIDKQKLSELAISIKAVGLKQPITVSRSIDRPGYYYIEAGERRYRVHVLLGLPTIKCTITEDSYDGKLSASRVLEQAAENGQREPQTHSEITRVLSLLIDEEREIERYGAVDRAKKRLCEAFGKSMPWAENYRAMIGLHENLMLQVDDGILPFVIAVMLARVEKSTQIEILNEARSRKGAESTSVLQRYVGELTRGVPRQSGRSERQRPSERRAPYFKFHASSVAALERMLGHMTTAQYEAFEAECLATADVHEVDLALSNALRMREFFTQRVAFLQAKREKNYEPFK